MKIFAAILLVTNLILLGLNIHLGITGNPEQFIHASINAIGAVLVLPILTSKKRSGNRISLK